MSAFPFNEFRKSLQQELGISDVYKTNKDGFLRVKRLKSLSTGCSIKSEFWGLNPMIKKESYTWRH